MPIRKVLLLFVVFLTTIYGYGEVLYVTNGNNSGTNSLRAQIQSGGINDTILVNYRGSIQLNTPILISGRSNITIIGPYPIHNSFFASGIANLFEIENSSNIVFKGFGFKDQTGAELDVRSFDISNSTVTFYDCLFEGNKPNANGGAMYIHNTAEIKVFNCSFFNNIANDPGTNYNGGAVYFDITNNKAVFENCTFYKNEADGYGGAIYIDTASSLNSFNFFNNTFIENVANIAAVNSGDAIWFKVSQNFSIPAAYFVFLKNNIFALNGNQSYSTDYQVYYNNPASLHPKVSASNNYVLKFSASEAVSTNLTNNFLSPDYVGVQGTNNLLLRPIHVTDGYGLKYFTIVSGLSPLINSGTNGTYSGYTTFSKDCRRAPRMLNTVKDIGAAEYTQFRVVSTGNNDWRNLLDALTLSTDPENYIEFDLPLGSEVLVKQNFNVVNNPVYVDGFSLNGSQIPGPNNFGVITTEYTPASNLISFIPFNPSPNTNGMVINAQNVTVTGVNFRGFKQYGILTTAGTSQNFKLQGCHIGIEETGVGMFETASSIGNQYGGLLLVDDNALIGGYFHHERNVITGNGFDPSGTYNGANIHINNASNIAILGNVIGLSPEGKDSLDIFRVNGITPDGIYMSQVSSSTIGRNYMFGRNIISNNVRSGIYHFNAGTANKISHNSIGVNFGGMAERPNLKGIELESSLNAYVIGIQGGNIISGNKECGIVLSNTENVSIFANTIGGNSDLSASVPNDIGVEIIGTSKDNIIGGHNYLLSNHKNTIVGNRIGINIHGVNTSDNIITANLIGVPNHTAITALPNEIGIRLADGTQGNLVGYNASTSLTTQINFISGNLESGILIEDAATGNNQIRSNLIGSTLPGSGQFALGNKFGVRIRNVSTVNHIGNENDNNLSLMIHSNEIGIKIDTSSLQNIYNTSIGINAANDNFANEIGVYISPLSEQIKIGGNPAQRNIISHNDSIGVFIDRSNNNTVFGNLIGLTNNGLGAAGNKYGVFIKEGDNNVIGADNQENWISGNKFGLLLTDQASSNVITYNYFGQNETGNAIIPGSKVGIVIRDVDNSNLIGGDITGPTNYFNTDSIDVLIASSSNQTISGNIFGFNQSNTGYIGLADDGIGILLKNSDNNIIGGSATNEQNIIANCSIGIGLDASESNRIQYNYLGSNFTGNNVLSPSNQGYSIGARNGSKFNIIGPKNVIGGSDIGIYFKGSSDSNLVYGNTIGVDASLTNALANDSGVVFSNSHYNKLGNHTILDSSNTIVNGNYGVVLSSGANNNKVLNNYIGVTSLGTAMGNLLGGIKIESSNNNKIGSVNLQSRNRISYNKYGIEVTDNSSVGNSFLRNDIFSNINLGIDILGDNLPNDNLTTGIQNNTQIPELISGYSCLGLPTASLTVNLRDLVPGEKYYIDLYNISNSYSPDPSGYGESGQAIYFDSIIATATQEAVSVNLSGLGMNPVIDTLYTAILTAVNSGSSSEFSMHLDLNEGPVPAILEATSEVCKFLDNGEILIDNSANSSYIYSLYFDGILQTETSPDSLLTENLLPGSYPVSIVYTNGCSDDSLVVLSVGPTINLSTAISADTCGLDNGQIILTPVPDSVGYFNNPFTYTISSGSSSSLSDSIFPNLTAGLATYSFIKTTIGGEDCYSDTLAEIIPSFNYLTANLNFIYNDFCQDTVGYVLTPPIVGVGTYQINTTFVGHTFDPVTGNLSNAATNGIYDITYTYGTCISDIVTVNTLTVPSDDFTYTDFCQNDPNPLPSAVTSGGTYSIYSAPIGSNGVINDPVTGVITSNALPIELSVGNYEVIYNTNDANCPRQDTVLLAVLGKPNAPILNTDLILPIVNDTVFFCRNTVDTIHSNISLSYWSLIPPGTVISDSKYFLNPQPVGADTTLYYFRDTTYLSGDVCYSDTLDLVIHLYDVPTQPIITGGDIDYCNNEIINDLNVTNAVNWFAGDLTTIDGTGFSFTPTFISDTTMYYAQEVSTDNCKSDIDSVHIVGYLKPVLYGLSNLGTAIIDTISFCRNEITPLDSDFEPLNWYLENDLTILTGTSYNLVDLPAGPDTSLFYYRDTLYEGVKTCYSDTGEVVINLYDVPVDISILPGDTAYCEGETIMPLNVLNGVNWYEGDLTVVDGMGLSYNPNTTPGDTLKYYAQEVTINGCKSNIDSISVIIYNKPITPIITNPLPVLDTISFCRNLIETIESDYYNTRWHLSYADLATSASTYLLADLPTSQDTTLYFYRDSVLLDGRTCYSDTNNVTIHLHDTPDQPDIMPGGSEYCEYETIVPLTNVAAVNWYKDNLSTPVTATAQLNYLPIFANNSTYYYAQAETSEGCLSLVDSVNIKGYLRPVTPTVTSGASAALNNLTFSICRNLLDDFDNNFTDTQWYLENDASITTGLSYTLSPLSVGQDTILFFFRDTLYNGTKTCNSDTNFVSIHLHDVPNQPNIVPGDSAYCEYEIIAPLTNVAPVKWYMNDLVTPVTAGAQVSYLPNFNNSSIYYYAQAESVEGCLSLLDSVYITGYLKPAIPSVTTVGSSTPINNTLINYCRNTLPDFQSNFAATEWYFENGTSSGQSSIFNLNPLPVGQDTTIFFYKDTLYNGTKVCGSDTNWVDIHIYNVPDAPIITEGDTSYCEYHTIADLSTTVGNSIYWYVNSTASSPLFGPTYSPTSPFTITETNVYFGQVVSAEGCKSLFDTTYVSFHPQPSVPILIDLLPGSSLTYCSDIIEDTLSTNSSFTVWNLAANDSTLYIGNDYTIPSNFFADASMNDIEYFVVDIYNCSSDTNFVNVTISLQPVLAPQITTSDSVYCEYETDYATLIATNISTNVSGMVWFNRMILPSQIPQNYNDTLSNSASFTIPNILPPGDTVFYFVYINSFSCVSVYDSITIHIEPTPAAAIISSIDSVYCLEESVELLSTDIDVDWYFQDPTIAPVATSVTSFTPNQNLLAGQYAVYSQHLENDCLSDLDTFEITIHNLPPIPVLENTNINFCEEQTLDSLLLPIGSNGVWFYNEDFSDTLSKNTDFYVPIQNLGDSNVYHVQVVDGLTGCFSGRNKITFYKIEPIGLSAGDDIELCSGFETELNATGGQSYLWSSNIISGNTLPNPTVNPITDTEYYVEITDENGCTKTDTVNVRIKMTDCEAETYNSFTPNGDGTNETWIIDGIHNLPDNVVYIYNRWGDRIALIENYDNVENVWGGLNYITNTLVPFGTYYFLLESEGKKIESGWIQVLR